MGDILTVSAVTKKVGKSTIINNISFSLPKCSIVGFLGLNGAGKTTTLNAISKTIQIDNGIIRVENEVLKENNKNTVIFLPDTPLIYPVLTGSEYLNMMGELLEVDLKNVSYYLKKLNLENAMDKKISGYSLGMKKKLTLIPLLLKQPKVLLLDEFISGIDPVSMRDVKDILNQYVANDNSVLLSTHQLDVVENFCDHILLIHQGEIQDSLSNTKEVLKNYGSLENYFIQKINNSGGSFK